MTDPTPAERPRAWGRALALVGAVLALAAIAFVVDTVVDSWDEGVDDAVAGAEAGWLVAAAAFAAAGMTWIGVGWARTLAVLGDRLPVGDVIARYYVGEIGKYLPGSLWPVLGRGELAARAGVTRSRAYSSVALSLTVLYLAAGLVVAGALPFMVDGGSDVPWWPLLAIPVGVGLLATGVLDRLRRIAERIVSRPLPVEFPAPRASALLVGVYLPVWAFIGLATWSTARALDPGAPFWPVVGAAVLSWLAGFVAVPVPGGVGVREAVFVAAVAGLSSGVAATVALVARVLFVLVDAAGWAVGTVVLARRRRISSRS